MGPDSGMAIGIGLVAFVLPAACILCSAVLTGWALWKRRWLFVGLGAGLALAVVAVWFFSFGIEYVPKYEPSPLVVAEGYQGAVLLVACENKGVPEGETLTVGDNGMVYVQRPQRTDLSHREWRAERVSGAPVMVSTIGGEHGPDGCVYHQLHVGTEDYGHSTHPLVEMEKEAKATGKPFSEVFEAHRMR